MTRRAGVTLVEVLVAIMVMGIGMLALLTLFPLGALTMAQALKDNRCADCGATAAAIAQALDLKSDTSLRTELESSEIVLIDPLGLSAGYQSPIPGTSIPRFSLESITNASNPPARRSSLFSIQDDLEFLENGQANNNDGTLRRGGRYTWSFLVKRLDSDDLTKLDLWVIVYKDRALTSGNDETTANAGNAALGETQLVLTGASAPPNCRRGTWIMDATTADFYRVVSSTVSGNSATVEVEPPLRETIGNNAPFVVLENVAEVFYRGPIR